MKVNGNVAFEEDGHKYFNIKDPSIEYISVTTLIGRYENEFDKEFVSKYKSLEKLMPTDVWKKERGGLWKSHRIPENFLEVYGIDEKELNAVQQDILDEWARTNQESCERGTKIHAELENSMYKAGSNVNLKKYGIGGKFVCKKDYSELDLPYGVYPEYLIYYDNPKINLHIAGQIDLLVKDENVINIIDYKTNKELKFKGFFNSTTKSEQKMLFPLTNLADCNFNHYQLQLSLYAWILQKINPEFEIGKLIISHYDHNNNNTLYDVQYLKDDVERMLQHYVKTKKIETQKAKYAKVVY